MSLFGFFFSSLFIFSPDSRDFTEQNTFFQVIIFTKILSTLGKRLCWTHGYSTHGAAQICVYTAMAFYMP